MLKAQLCKGFVTAVGRRRVRLCVLFSQFVVITFQSSPREIEGVPLSFTQHLTHTHALWQPFPYVPTKAACNSRRLILLYQWKTWGNWGKEVYRIVFIPWFSCFVSNPVRTTTLFYNLLFPPCIHVPHPRNSQCVNCKVRAVSSMASGTWYNANRFPYGVPSSSLRPPSTHPMWELGFLRRSRHFNWKHLSPSLLFLGSLGLFVWAHVCVQACLHVSQSLGLPLLSFASQADNWDMSQSRVPSPPDLT